MIENDENDNDIEHRELLITYVQHMQMKKKTNEIHSKIRSKNEK